MTLKVDISKPWVEVVIGEVAEVVGGGTPKAGDPQNFEEAGTGISWLTPADLSGYSKKYISHGKRDLSQAGYDSSSAKLMPPESLLFSSRAPIGYVVISEGDICTNQGFKNFVFTSDVDSGYAYYYLRSIRSLAESLGTGTTFKEISATTAKKLPFLLPPVAEQKVIADKLDSLLAQVETTKARLDRVPDILKRFRQSVLAAAVSGRFQTNVVTYQTRTLDSLCLPGSTITYGVIKLGKDVEGGVPCLRTSNVRWLNIETSTIKQIAPEISESYSRTVLEGGEVLVNVRGTLGGVAAVPNEMAGWNVSREVAVVPLDSTIASSKFIELWIASRQSQQWLAGVSKGVAYVGINLQDLRNLPVELPSTLEEQDEIVRRVEELFAFADAVEQKAQAASERVNKLTQSILAKAFRGELTADWRAANPDLISGENSAEALLEKIKVEREAMKPKKKARAKKVKS